MNFSSWVLDHYDMLDASQVTMDSMEKVANALGSGIMTSEERARQMDSDFGLVVIASGGRKTRRYPINTPFDAFMSKAAYVMNKNSLPEGAKKIAGLRISAAAHRYSLPVVDGFEKNASFVPPSNVYVMSLKEEAKLDILKMASLSSPPTFAITEGLDGGVLERYPINDPKEVSMRIDSFDKIAHKMDIKYAFQFADNVSAAAEKHNVPIPADSKLNLYKTANLSPTFRKSIASRIRVAPEAVSKSYMDVMCKTASADPRQIAVAIDSIDRSCGMEMLYGSAFPDAAESTLSITKQANVIEVGNLEVNIDDVRSAISKDPEVFKKILDEETLEALKKDTEVVFKALPAPYQQMIIHTIGNDVS